MPFANPVMAGRYLVRQVMESAGYIAGQTGWQITRDGSAEFQNLTVRGGQAVPKITIAATAPASPQTGDLWYDSAAGYTLNQYDGTAWAPYQLGTGAIAPGSITAALIAAGTVIAGIVDGTTITGATFNSPTTQGDVLQIAQGIVNYLDASGAILDLIEFGSDFIAFYVGDGTPGQYQNVLTLDTAQAQITGSLSVTGTASYSAGTRTGLGSLGATGLDITVSTFEPLPDGKVFFSIKGHATANISSGNATFPVSLPAALRPATATELPAAVGGTVAAGDNWPRLFVAGGSVTLYWPTLGNGRSISCQAVMDTQ